MGDIQGLGLYYQKNTKSFVFGHFGGNQLQDLIKKYEDKNGNDLNFSNIRIISRRT